MDQLLIGSRDLHIKCELALLCVVLFGHLSASRLANKSGVVGRHARAQQIWKLLMVTKNNNTGSAPTAHSIFRLLLMRSPLQNSVPVSLS
jgi:hypothetical protein